MKRYGFYIFAALMTAMILRVSAQKKSASVPPTQKDTAPVKLSVTLTLQQWQYVGTVFYNMQSTYGKSLTVDKADSIKNEALVILGEFQRQIDQQLKVDSTKKK